MRNTDDNSAITLIDVMTGIHKWRLYSQLPPAQFRFLIGLIMKANEMGFTVNPLPVTNAEAMSLGAGNSRQSVHRIREQLCKFRLAGKKLVNVSSGNFGRNTTPKYKINYALLTRFNGVWNGTVKQPSQKHDGSVDNSAFSEVEMPQIAQAQNGVAQGTEPLPSQKHDGSGDSTPSNRHKNMTVAPNRQRNRHENETLVLTNPRSEEKRKETTTTSSLVSTPGGVGAHACEGGEADASRGGGFVASLDTEEEEEPRVQNTANDVSEFQGACLTKWRGQLVGVPPPSQVRHALEEFPIATLLEGLSRCPDIPRPRITPEGAINLALKAARNPDWWKPRELKPAAAAESESLELRTVRRGLERAFENQDDDAVYGWLGGLSKETGEPIESVYEDVKLERRDLLPLDDYKSLYEEYLEKEGAKEGKEEE